MYIYICTSKAYIRLRSDLNLELKTYVAVTLIKYV